jgi:hypothetical protein
MISSGSELVPSSCALSSEKIEFRVVEIWGVACVSNGSVLSDVAKLGEDSIITIVLKIRAIDISLNREPFIHPKTRMDRKKMYRYSSDMDNLYSAIFF